MPIVSGWDILTFMRNRKIEIPVIILTSLSAASRTEKSLICFHNVFSFQLQPLTKSGFNELPRGYYLHGDYKTSL